MTKISKAERQNINTNKVNRKWDDLKQWTTARVGLEFNGHALSTKALLEFQRAHAAARSAVHWVWDYTGLEKKLITENESPNICFSQASTQELFLKFPQKGRVLSETSKNQLASFTKSKQNHFSKNTCRDQILNTNVEQNFSNSNSSESIVFIISNGLSSLAIENHFLEFWKVFKKHLYEKFPELKYQLVLVPFGRVAISDDIGETLKARMSVIFIGERPGLNSPDSMGIYLTYKPQLGNSDANRNCISNVRVPYGLDYSLASEKLIYLISESFRLQISGVQLKDELVGPVQLK
ncbi:MAG: ethanolamine ammonia-lyase subunit EutC [Bdellovibrio sp.]